MPTTNCLICGAELEYFPLPRKMNCAVCGKEYETTAACKEGHFICDACHMEKGIAAIQKFCRESDSKNPVLILQKIMVQPEIYMHGPEHHVMVGAALLTAYKNSGGKIDFNRALTEMIRRGQQVPGGVCGFWGCCGAGVSAGIFISIITESTPLSKEEWGIANQMTARALQAIGNLGGPRCCKRDSFTSVREAVLFVREHLNIDMELSEQIICGFSRFNDQCKGKSCPYYKGQ